LIGWIADIQSNGRRPDRQLRIDYFYLADSAIASRESARPLAQLTKLIP
jgi:hypothetical protein